jgi:hypothetical protein
MNGVVLDIMELDCDENTGLVLRPNQRTIRGHSWTSLNPPLTWACDYFGDVAESHLRCFGGSK